MAIATGTAKAKAKASTRKKKHHKKTKVLGRAMPIMLQDDDGNVDVPQPHVSKHNLDEIVWHGNGHKAVVVFGSPKGSPFAADVFRVPKNGNVHSGPALGALDTYKYTVVGQNKSNDPEVIVDM